MGTENETATGNDDALSAIMIEVPKFSASVFNVSVTPTEVMLLASSLMPGISPAGDIVSGPKPQVVLSMSPQSAKELALVIEGVISTYEEAHGPIRTPFIDERTKA